MSQLRSPPISQNCIQPRDEIPLCQRDSSHSLVRPPPAGSLCLVLWCVIVTIELGRWRRTATRHTWPLLPGTSQPWCLRLCVEPFAISRNRAKGKRLRRASRLVKVGTCCDQVQSVCGTALQDDGVRGTELCKSGGIGASVCWGWTRLCPFHSCCHEQCRSPLRDSGVGGRSCVAATRPNEP